eukprot:13409672-Heterocapsa_arctica.AAC.1
MAMVVADGNKQQQQQLDALALAKGERDAAYDDMRALDHTLKLAGSSLQKFPPAAHATFANMPNGRLQAGEKRYFSTYSGPLPYQVLAEVSSKVQFKRAVSEDSRSGERRYEVPELVDERPTVAFCCDEGSKLCSALWFMCGHLKLRGCWLRDPGHRGWRDFHGAVGEMGWSSLVHEALVVMNFKFAPWLSESFYVQLKEGLESWIVHGSIDNVLFQTLYQKIARDLGEAEHPAFGTTEHMQKIFHSISTDLAFVRK